MEKYLEVWDKDQKEYPVYKHFANKIYEKGLSDKFGIYKTGFIGFYSNSPMIKIIPDNIIYSNFTDYDADEILENIEQNKILEKFRLKYDNRYLNIPEKNDINKQYKIVTRNSGYIDPENINDYIARNGYKALEKVIFDITADDVINELKISRLRGRGGAGFPTGIKWEYTQKQESNKKYIICNADEGDPGAYMDRSILESDPHSIIEGMVIAGYTVGAEQGYIYIRAEYPLAIKRLEIAIQQAKNLGLIGTNILGSNFNFDIELRLGAGAFVCGEETALIASIEGKRGNPRPRPPFPAIEGLWEEPTVINNVETFANIPVILDKGGKWFAGVGTEKSSGTKVFALTGKVVNPGLVEVPMGTTLREIIFDIGGGITDNKRFKAVQIGGPSGSILPEQYLDIPVDYENLESIGSIMGSGGMIVMDEDDCIVDITKFYLQFSIDESCGKCFPCRIGGKQLYELLTKISDGNGKIEDITKLKRIGMAMQKASLCGLGKTTPNPVISTLNYFEQEYMDHIKNKTCKPGKCKNLVTYLILEGLCTGCHLCVMKCPVNAINGRKRNPHNIIQDNCIKCGQCAQICKFNAIKRY